MFHYPKTLTVFDPFSYDDFVTFEPGTRVVFKTVVNLDPDNVILPGMLGVVVDHPFAYSICTPGVSMMMLPVGKREAFGYYNRYFEPLGREPGREEIERSLDLWNRALEIYQDLHGYQGFVRVGNKVYSQDRALHDLRVLSRRISAWLEAGETGNHLNGTLKRLKKTLLAFHQHPFGSEAVAIGESLPDRDPDAASFADAEAAIHAWVPKAAKTNRGTRQADRYRRVMRGFQDGML